MVDYTAIADRAAALLQANGRQITVVQLDQSAANPSEPWKGAADPRGTPVDSVNVYAAPLHPESLVNLGSTSRNNELVLRAELLYIVAPGSAITQDLSLFHEVLDEGVRRGIILAEKMRPQSVNLLYFLWVAR